MAGFQTLQQKTCFNSVIALMNLSLVLLGLLEIMSNILYPAFIDFYQLQNDCKKLPPSIIEYCLAF